jgi:hypothetical protein
MARGTAILKNQRGTFASKISQYHIDRLVYGTIDGQAPWQATGKLVFDRYPGDCGRLTIFSSDSRWKGDVICIRGDFTRENEFEFAFESSGKWIEVISDLNTEKIWKHLSKIYCLPVDRIRLMIRQATNDFPATDNHFLKALQILGDLPPSAGAHFGDVLDTLGGYYVDGYTEDIRNSGVEEFDPAISTGYTLRALLMAGYSPNPQHEYRVIRGADVREWWCSHLVRGTYR